METGESSRFNEIVCRRWTTFYCLLKDKIIIMSSLIQTIFCEFKFQHPPPSSTVISSDNFVDSSLESSFFLSFEDTKTRKYQITYSVIQYWSIFIRGREWKKFSQWSFQLLATTKNTERLRRKKIVYNSELTISYMRLKKREDKVK